MGRGEGGRGGGGGAKTSMKRILGGSYGVNKGTWPYHVLGYNRREE